MAEYPLALYGAFSETPFGGGIAGIIDQASTLSTECMQQIAREIGAPATGFITNIDEVGVDVRFFSTLTEYPMCGHVTIGLMTWLAEHGRVDHESDGPVRTTLRTPAATSEVLIRRRADGRPEVMLTLTPAVFESANVNVDELADLLGVTTRVIHEDLDMTITTTDFRSLLIPIRDVKDLEAVTPDFSAIKTWCRRVAIDTIALFAPASADAGKGIRCREFCPAIGTPESAASGTTNRAICCYLYQSGQLDTVKNGSLMLRCEQGHEVGRPSVILSELSAHDGEITEVRVGGVATKTIEGKFFLA